MKKILTLLVLVSSLFALSACQSAFSNTKVRVVGLSYRTSADELASVPSNNSMRLLSNKLVADEVEEYIFPGDVLTFTVELEDPNFEFISLLSIKFNDQIIRANVDNSIVTTRDCGANICVDFPFEITADKSEYSVQEVKFAKLNSDNGVNAIIDNQSAKKVSLNLYPESIFPYVLEAVEKLNSHARSFKYIVPNTVYDSYELYHQDFWGINDFDPNFQHLGKRIVFFENYTFTNRLELFFSDKLNNKVCACWEQEPNYMTISDGIYFSELKVYDQNSSKTGSFLYYTLYSSDFADTAFFNVGNSIYVTLLGKDYLLLEMQGRTRVWLPSEVINFSN